MATPIQFTTNGVVSGALTVAFPANVRASTAIFFCSLSTVTTESITGITDTRGNTYTEQLDITVGAFRFEIWTAPNPNAGANTVSPSYTATVGSHRGWVIEIGDMGSFTIGSSASLDQTVAQDPMTLAALTSLTANGIALVVLATDTASTLAGYTDADGGPTWVNMGSGGSSHAAYRLVGPSTPNISPKADFSTTETGESVILAVASAASGGAASAAYVG